jgi:hypothetical protein
VTAAALSSALAVLYILTSLPVQASAAAGCQLANAAVTSTAAKDE